MKQSKQTPGVSGKKRPDIPRDKAPKDTKSQKAEKPARREPRIPGVNGYYKTVFTKVIRYRSGKIRYAWKEGKSAIPMKIWVPWGASKT